MFPYTPPLCHSITVTIHKRPVIIDIRQPWVDIGRQLKVGEFDAKALFTLGMMRRYVLSANSVLQCMHHRGFLSAYALLSSSIELLGRCVHPDQHRRQHPSQFSGDRLAAGLEAMQPSHLPSSVIVETNHYKQADGGYNVEDLKNLRNLAVHGGSITTASQIKGDIELLHEMRKAFFGILEGENDSHRGSGPLSGALDQYCNQLLNGDSVMCDQLADAGISPDPVQFVTQGWPIGVQVINEIREHISKNLRGSRKPISGGHTKSGDSFQLY